MKNSLFAVGVEGVRRLLFLIPARPRVAQIATTNKCNFNCLMCQRIPLKVPIKNMEFPLYKKVVDRLDGIEEVILTGWGEPFYHPKIIRMIKYSKDKKMKVSLTSNGSLLTASLAEKLLQTGIDSISFSIDDIRAPKTKSVVHPITTQITNIKDFIKRAKKRKNGPRIIIQTTLHRGGESKIMEVVKWASEVGAGVVNVNRLDMRFSQNLKRPDLEGEKKFIEKLDEAGRKYQITTEFRPHIAFSGFSRKIYRFLAPMMQRGGQHCLRVYNYVYINLSGEVTPCCALPLWSVGNLLEEDLLTIWQADKFKKFRQHNFQRKVCGRCDVLEIKQYS